MILSQLLSSIITEEVHGSDAIAIESVVSDSRQVGAGSLFVAVPGPVADGHNFINAALEKGAVAVVCERLPQTGGALLGGDVLSGLLDGVPLALGEALAVAHQP